MVRFLKLRSAYPKALLLPTGDILFAELAHIFRTAAYHRDLGGNIASDPLLLAAEERPLFNDAVRTTAALWRDTFGDGAPYLPTGMQVPEHKFAHTVNMTRGRPPPTDIM